MALPRFLLSAVAAALLSACSGSYIGEFGAEKPQLTKISAESSSQAARDADSGKIADAASGDQQAAISKVALTLSSASDPNSKAYKIGPRDVLEVTVFKVPDLPKVVQVSEAGTINYPLVGELQAGGRTARELEQDLARLLGAKYLQNPQISVLVKEYNSQRITLEGAVKKPGVYPIVGGNVAFAGDCYGRWLRKQCRRNNSSHSSKDRQVLRREIRCLSDPPGESRGCPAGSW